MEESQVEARALRWLVPDNLGTQHCPFVLLVLSLGPLKCGVSFMSYSASALCKVEFGEWSALLIIKSKAEGSAYPVAVGPGHQWPVLELASGDFGQGDHPLGFGWETSIAA